MSLYYNVYVKIYDFKTLWLQSTCGNKCPTIFLSLFKKNFFCLKERLHFYVVEHKLLPCYVYIHFLRSLLTYMDCSISPFLQEKLKTATEDINRAILQHGFCLLH